MAVFIKLFMGTTNTRFKDKTCSFIYLLQNLSIRESRITRICSTEHGSRGPLFETYELSTAAGEWYRTRERERKRKMERGENEEAETDGGQKEGRKESRETDEEERTVSRYLPARHVTLSLSFAWVSSTGHRGFDFADRASRSASKLHRRSNKLECTRGQKVCNTRRDTLSRDISNKQRSSASARSLPRRATLHSSTQCLCASSRTQSNPVEQNRIESNLVQVWQAEIFSRACTGMQTRKNANSQYQAEREKPRVEEPKWRASGETYSNLNISPSSRVQRPRGSRWLGNFDP